MGLEGENGGLFSRPLLLCRPSFLLPLRPDRGPFRRNTFFDRKLDDRVVLLCAQTVLGLATPAQLKLVRRRCAWGAGGSFGVLDTMTGWAALHSPPIPDAMHVSERTPEEENFLIYLRC